MKIKVIFVCLGNICRSPAAEEIFRTYVKEAGLSEYIEVDSCGTYSGHTGDMPDPRMRLAAGKRGYDLTSRARGIHFSDFEEATLILTMDDSNFDKVRSMAPDPESTDKICRLTDFCKTHKTDHIPDPYYGGSQGFDNVLDVIEDACLGLLNHIKQKYRL